MSLRDLSDFYDHLLNGISFPSLSRGKINVAIIKLARDERREYYSWSVGDNGESARESDIREYVIDNREWERELSNVYVIFTK